MAEEPKTPLKYLMYHLNEDGKFLSEWKNMKEKDKTELKQWAEEEIKFKQKK